MTLACAGPLRVLVVEDEVMLLLMLEAILTDIGHCPTLCSTQADARAQMRDGACFDLAIIDLGLPDGNGVGLIQALWATSPGLPVIVSTGYSELPAEPLPAERAGRLALVAKPYGPDELEAAMRQVLGRVRQVFSSGRPVGFAGVPAQPS